MEKNSKLVQRFAFTGNILNETPFKTFSLEELFACVASFLFCQKRSNFGGSSGSEGEREGGGRTFRGELIFNNFLSF